MKKTIIILSIYVSGVIVGIIMGLDYLEYLRDKYEAQTDYGDVAMIVATSLMSWVDVAALTVLKISRLDFWNIPF